MGRIPKRLKGTLKEREREEEVDVSASGGGGHSLAVRRPGAESRAAGLTRR